MQKRYLYLLIVLILLTGCASTGGNRYGNLDTLMEDAAWEVIDILWEAYEDLDNSPDMILVVSYFAEGDAASALSDELIDSLTTLLANALRYEGIPVKVVTRQRLDQILAELSFQFSDLADEETQLVLGKQLGANLMLTGRISEVEGNKKITAQLLEIETGAVLGGFLSYLDNGERD